MMQQCRVCGQTYGLTHSCPGAIPVVPAAASRWLAPAGFAPVYYFRQALAIARCEDEAILAASRDNNALTYGAIFWLIGQLLLFAPGVARYMAVGVEINWFLVTAGITMLILSGAVLVLAQYAICHLLARWWFGARGTYLGVLRAMLLGSIVMWLAVIPYVGMTVAGLWNIAILMRVFEEVDGIERMKAFGLALVVGLVFMALAFMLLAPRPAGPS